MWLTLAIVSGLLFGFYEVSKKIALKDNDVIMVLFASITVAAVMAAPFLVVSEMFPDTLRSTAIYVPRIPSSGHIYIFIRSVVVLAALFFAFYGMKNLPITIASTIKSARPVFVIIGAIVIFSERLNLYQWAGIIITMAAVFGLSMIHAEKVKKITYNKSVLFILFSTLLGALNKLGDKWLIENYNEMSIHVYTVYYQFVIINVILFFLVINKAVDIRKFKFKWSIVALVVFLFLSEFTYFYALDFGNSSLAVISTIRKTGVIVPFIWGAVFLKEKKIVLKLFYLAVIFLGMYMLYQGI